jgi:hypothetical protein
MEYQFINPDDSLENSHSESALLLQKATIGSLFIVLFIYHYSPATFLYLLLNNTTISDVLLPLHSVLLCSSCALRAFIGPIA